MDTLQGKIAVITGGAGGIGLATGRLLGQQGMNVVLVDVNESRLAEAAELCREESLDVSTFVADVSDYSAVKSVADTIFARHGTVHFLHLNAGIGGGGSLFDDVTENWERVIGVNLKGVVWGIKAFVPRMVDAGESGYVIATSSGAGAEGTSYQNPSYASTKNAVVSIMECLYGQLRDKSSLVRAGILFPPLTATNLAGDVSFMKTVEAGLRAGGVPVVLVEPEQVAEVVLDGIRRERFFVRVGPRESTQFFDDKIGHEYFAWNERVMRGRTEQVLTDGLPDDYLW